MSQTLASAQSDGRPLDFGTVDFSGPGGCMVVTRGTYRMTWPDHKASDVTLSAVADDYEIPVTRPQKGRDIKRHEFLDCGEATDSTKFEAILANMPEVAEYLDDYADVAEIKFADAQAPTTSLARLLTLAVAKGIITPDTVTAFLANWARLYPAV